MAVVPDQFFLPLAFSPTAGKQLLTRPLCSRLSHNANDRLLIILLNYWSSGDRKLRKLWRPTLQRRSKRLPFRQSTVPSDNVLGDCGTSKGPSPALHLFLDGLLIYIIIVASYANNVLQLDDPTRYG